MQIKLLTTCFYYLTALLDQDISAYSQVTIISTAVIDY